MDFGQINLGKINIEFKEMNNCLNSQRSHAKVIVIDRTHPDSAQQCYTLKNEATFDDSDIENLKKKFQDFAQEDFILIGEIESLNKSDKSILLKSKNSISYDHLIIASGSHYSLLSYEFIAGVQTLVDAIRVSKKIPAAFPEALQSFTQNPSKKKMKSSKTDKNDLNFPKKIENLQSKKINRSKDNPSHTMNNSKRLYEVQV